VENYACVWKLGVLGYCLPKIRKIDSSCFTLYK